MKLPYVFCLNRKGLQYLEGLGITVRDYFRPSEEKETERNFLFREHMLAISDLLIQALLFERSELSYRLERLSHERVFKNTPIKATYIGTGSGNRRAEVFRKRLRAYIVFLKSRAFETVFNVTSMTIAFATTKDHHRLNKMREWARQEFALTNEPGWLAELFLFTTLPENMSDIAPRQLFLDPVWYTPSDDTNPVSLLRE
jgi:hypothetical protein